MVLGGFLIFCKVTLNTLIRHLWGTNDTCDTVWVICQNEVYNVAGRWTCDIICVLTESKVIQKSAGFVDKF